MKQLLATAYGRTSQDDGKKVSIDVQKLDFEKECKKQGWINGGFFYDKDISGRSYPALNSEVEKYDVVTIEYLKNEPAKKRCRPGLAEALSVEGTSILFVRDTSRFYRPLSGSFLESYLRGVLEKKGISLWSGEAGLIDWSKFETEITQAISNISADRILKKQKKQSLDSILKKRDAGQLYVSPRCLGFRSDGSKRIKSIPEELKTVKRIFADYLSGKTIRQITLDLNTTKTPSYNGTVWSHCTLSNILRRPWYAGYSYDSKKNLIVSEPFQPYSVITKTEFLQTLDRLDKNPSLGIRRESKYFRPLSGLLICGKCGSKLRPVIIQGHQGNQFYYRCTHSPHVTYNKSLYCKEPLLRETYGIPATITQPHGYKSEDGVGMGILEFIAPFIVPSYIRNLKSKDTTPELLTRKAEIAQNIEALKAKDFKRYKDYEDGIITKDIYRKLSAEFKAEMQREETDLQAIVTEINQQVSKTQIQAKDLDDLAGISAKDYQTLIRNIIDKITVYSHKISITFKDDKVADIPRIQFGNQMQLPKPDVILPVDILDSENPESSDTQTTIAYHCKQDITTVAYECPDFKILLIP